MKKTAGGVACRKKSGIIIISMTDNNNVALPYMASTINKNKFKSYINKLAFPSQLNKNVFDRKKEIMFYLSHTQLYRV